MSGRYEEISEEKGLGYISHLGRVLGDSQVILDIIKEVLLLLSNISLFLDITVKYHPIMSKNLVFYSDFNDFLDI